MFQSILDGTWTWNDNHGQRDCSASGSQVSTCELHLALTSLINLQKQQKIQSSGRQFARHLI